MQIDAERERKETNKHAAAYEWLLSASVCLITVDNLLNSLVELQYNSENSHLECVGEDEMQVISLQLTRCKDKTGEEGESDRY